MLVNVKSNLRGYQRITFHGSEFNKFNESGESLKHELWVNLKIFPCLGGAVLSSLSLAREVEVQVFLQNFVTEIGEFSKHFLRKLKYETVD